MARELLSRGVTLTVTTRHPGNLRTIAGEGARVLSLDVEDPDSLASLRGAVPAGTLVVHSVPSVGKGSSSSDPTPALLEVLGDAPARIVYLSTTGVYGAAHDVDEQTQPAPRTARERLRLHAETAIAAGPWQSLILRPAAIYGPGRGVHEAMRRSEFKLRGDGSNWISRIHVDDLAAHVESALFSTVTGAFPVADEHPCPSREIASFCSHLLGLPMPASADDAALSETRRADRRVSGVAIRKLLGLTLRYPSYLSGIPASLIATGRDALS